MGSEEMMKTEISAQRNRYSAAALVKISKFIAEGFMASE